MPIKQIYICDKCGKETAESDLFLSGTFPGECTTEKVDQFDDPNTGNMRCTFSFEITQHGDCFIRNWKRELIENPIFCKGCIKQLIRDYLNSF